MDIEFTSDDDGEIEEPLEEFDDSDYDDLPDGRVDPAVIYCIERIARDAMQTLERLAALPLFGPPGQED